jgi:hypothetical protein
MYQKGKVISEMDFSNLVPEKHHSFTGDRLTILFKKFTLLSTFALQVGHQVQVVLLRLDSMPSPSWRSSF